jgi:hypothetical protein
MKRLLIVAIATSLMACQETRSPAPSSESQKAKNLELERESADDIVDQQMDTVRIKIETLRTEDEINRLEGRPSKNRLAIAKLEGVLQQDQILRRMERDNLRQLERLRQLEDQAPGSANEK